MKKIISFNFFYLIISFLSIVLLLRFLFTLIIFYWNVPQTDDFCFMAKMHDYGTIASVKWWYLNWQGRFLPQLFTNLILLLYQKSDNMLVYGILIITLFCFSLYRCFVRLLKKINFKLLVSDKFILFIFSVSVFCLLLDFHMDTTTLYWINVSTMYFWGVIFLLLGISELLNPKRNILSFSVLLISFIYVGCSSEHFSLLMLGLLSMFYIVQRFFSTVYLNIFSLDKLVWAIILSSISFMIMYLAPGNSVRLASTHQPSLLKGLHNIPKFLNILYFNRLSLNSGYLIFAFLFSLSFGSFFSHRVNFSQEFLRRVLYLSSIILVYLILGTVFIFSFLLDYKGSTRAFVHISLAITLFIVCIGFLIGVFVSTKQKLYVNFIFLITVGIYFSTVMFKFKFNLKPTINYEISVKQRLSKVRSMAIGNNHFLVLPKLVNSPQNILLDGELASRNDDNPLIGFNKCLNAAFGMKDKPIILVNPK